MKPAREPATSRPQPCASPKKPHESCPLTASCRPSQEENRPWSEINFPPSNLTVRAFASLRTGIQHSPGSSTIERPSALAEFGACPPGRALTGSSRQCSLPHACRHLPKGTNLELGRAHTWEHYPPQTIPPPCLNQSAESRRQPVGRISRGRARHYARRKDPPTLIPRN